jgi:hypothetical protein
MLRSVIVLIYFIVLFKIYNIVSSSLIIISIVFDRRTLSYVRADYDDEAGCCYDIEGWTYQLAMWTDKQTSTITPSAQRQPEPAGADMPEPGSEQHHSTSKRHWSQWPLHGHQAS